MKKLALAFMVVTLALSMAGCNALSGMSNYFAGFDDLIHGNKAEAAPTPPTSDQGTADTTTYTLTLVYQDVKAVDVTISADASLLPNPLSYSFPNAHQNDSFYEANLKAGTYTLAAKLGDAATVLNFQFDPSQSPVLLLVLGKTSDGSVVPRLIPLPSAAIQPQAPTS